MPCPAHVNRTNYGRTTSRAAFSRTSATKALRLLPEAQAAVPASQCASGDTLARAFFD